MPIKWIRRLLGKTSNVASESPAPPLTGFQQLFGTPAGGIPNLALGDVVIVGNCIAEGIQKGLSSVSLVKGYRFHAIPLHLRSLDNPESKQALGSSTHVFAQQIGAVDWDKLRKLAPAAEIFQYPDVVLRSHWPFDGSTGFIDDLASSTPDSKFRHQDGTLGRLRQIEPDKKKRIARYRALDFDWAPQIGRVIETQERFLHSIDEGSDIKLGSFVLKNCRENQLFYDPAHPSGIFFQHLCGYVLEKLEPTARPPSASVMDSWRDWSVPVHPAIAVQLGLSWAKESTRYRYATLGEVTWQEWVEAYIDEYG